MQSIRHGASTLYGNYNKKSHDYTDMVTTRKRFHLINTAVLFYFILFYVILFYFMYACRPEDGIRFCYRWLLATMWLLGIELKTSRRAASVLNH